jgi:hypothetical protein
MLLAVGRFETPRTRPDIGPRGQDENMAFQVILQNGHDPSTPEPGVAGFLMPDTVGHLIGSRLATTMSRLLGDEFTPPPEMPIFEGPHFVYEQNPRLFLGRRGRGPLRVAWDTNLLIDYFQQSCALWAGDCLPDIVPGEYGEELEGLQVVMAMWVLRDIRFYVPKLALRDAREKLTERQLAQRVRAFEEFAAALGLVEHAGEERELPPLILPDSELRRALEQMPAGNDRGLIEESVRRGMHVFMTRDANVLKARAALRPFGLYVATPYDLLEELTAIGALFCLLDPRFAYWPLPDMRRVTHLYRAALAG